MESGRQGKQGTQDSMTAVFDCTTRTDTSYKKRSESFFAYLNRSARRDGEACRALIEDWFSRLPVTEQKNSCSRFRCGSDAEFASPFQELFLHELLLRLGCKACFHPTIAGETTRPDFRVLQPDGSEFLLEAVTRTKVSGGTQRNPRANRIRDFLQGLNLAGYLIGIDELTAGSKDLSQRSLKRHISEELARTGADHYGHVSIPICETDDGWRIRLTAIPDTSHRGERMGSILYEVGCDTESDPSNPLRDALVEKGGYYGIQLLMSFVIAVNSFDPMLRDRDFHETLFGQRQVPKGDATTHLLPTHGFWGTAQNPRYRRVSAVLFTKNLWPATVLMGQVQTCLYLNPWPDRHCQGVLTTLDTVRFEDREPRFYPGTPIHELLQVPLQDSSLFE